MAQPNELIRSLHELPVGAILTDLPTHTFLAVNDRAASIYGRPADELEGTDVAATIHPDDRDAARATYAALADKVIDGYQVQRRVVRPDGTELAVDIWGRRVDGPGPPYGLWVLIPAAERGSSTDALVLGVADAVLAVTDHDWRIEYVGADAGLLGAEGSELRGFPLLGLVHPSSVGEFLAAVAGITHDHAVTLLVRMRIGEHEWAPRHCLLVRMCEHDPPRLGVVITAGPRDAPEAAASSSLEGAVRHCALEARSAKTLGALPALAGLPLGDELTGRQAEIVARLIAGERPAEIARSMFLSAATVRNHLSAIYRKFGVHSQTELLAALLRALAEQER